MWWPPSPTVVTYVLPPNSIPGVTSRQAKPGDTIVMYGVGFGPVTPSIPAGQIVQQNNSLATPVTFSFGGTPAAAPRYEGLAQTYVGLVPVQRGGSDGRREQPR